MPLFSSSSLPPGCADCMMSLMPAGAAAPQLSPWKMFRGGDGSMRFDFGAVSMISRPGMAGILLDHLAMQFRMMPPGAPPLPGGMSMPGLGLPGMPGGPPSGGTMQELGRMVIEGIMAVGMRYMMPGGQMAEMWTGTKLQLPVLIQMTGAFGQQTCRCAHIPGEPSPSMFQIPPNYTQFTPPAPPTPNVPTPGAPTLPTPGMPSLPNLPR